MSAQKDRYQKALDMALALAKARLRDELVALYLGGSYLRGDFIPGWSDIDITTIVKDEVWENESLKREFFKKCDTIRKEVENTYGIHVDIGLPLGTTSESVVHNKVNLALFLARIEQKLLFGQDVFKKAPNVDPERIPEWGKAATLQICDILLESLEREGTLKGKELVNLAKDAIVYLMKIAQNSLLMKGIVKLQKKEIVDAFGREYAFLESKGIVREAHELQLSWRQIFEGETDPQKLGRFIREAKVFTHEIKILALREKTAR